MYSIYMVIKLLAGGYSIYLYKNSEYICYNFIREILCVTWASRRPAALHAKEGRGGGLLLAISPAYLSALFNQLKAAIPPDVQKELVLR
jgi:hypothetical protein